MKFLRSAFRNALPFFLYKYLYIVWDGGGFTASGVVGENDDKGVIVS